MSAMGPEFFHFMQKLEENGDKLPPSTLSIIQQPFEFEFNNSTCNICNGYYGPSFGEPVCVTCHAFLFPDLPTYHPSTFFADKTDDRDSGNDEPSDLNYSAERRMVRLQFPPWFYRNSMDYETSPEDEPRQVEAGNPGPAVPAASGSGSGGSNDNAPPPADLAIHKKKKKNVPAVPDLRVGHSPPLPTPNVERFLQVLSTPRLPDNLEPGLVEQLPSEVLLCIFSYLDDLSLCACGAVSARWGGLVRARVPPPRWAHFVATRWPLYKPMQPHVDWYKKYLALVESSFCRNCLVQMCVLTQPTGDESHWRLNRLKTELKMLRNDPPEGIAATPLDPKSCHWQASVTGPVGSPYEGGVFYLYIQVPYNYPMSPPVVRFLTRIIHPNVSRHGDVGIDSVHHNWTLALTISKVLISIQSLLTDPYTAVCMEPELGEMYVHDRPRFESLARRWTWRYAMLDVFNQT